MTRSARSYLDYNATAPLRPEVRDAMLDAMDAVGNPSSVHEFGRRARTRVNDAREQVAALVGCAPGRVVFTSGGTEANHLALRAASHSITSPIEHDSVLANAPGAHKIGVEANGVIDLDDLDRALNDQTDTALVSVMWANNETGVVQPIETIVARAKAQQFITHSDAVQAAGKCAIDLTACPVDYLSLSSHKLGGPMGVGALIVPDGGDIHAALRGGGQERGWRAGTENMPGIVGFGTAAEMAQHALDDTARLATLRDRFENAVREVAPDAPTFGREAPRLANTSCLSMPGVAAETQVMALDLDGVAVSAGSACSSGKVTTSHVLTAMGVDAQTAGTAIRLSLGWATTEADIDHAIAAWTKLYRRAAPRVASAA